MNVLMLAAFVDGLDLPDKDLARCFWMGFQALGVLPDSHVHRALAPVSPSELYAFEGRYALIMSTNEQWHDQLESAVIRRNTKRSMTDAERLRNRAVIETTEKELAKGLISPAFTRGQLINKFGYGRARAMLRSAIYQKLKWRCIDDGRASLSNNATLSVETISTPSFEFALHVVRVATESRPGSPPIAWNLGLDDLQSAFRTIPTSEQRFNVFAVWSPAVSAVRYHYTFGFVFGLRSSVTQFNRFPAAMVAISRCLAAVPIGHFFDDYMIVDPVSAGSSGQDFNYEVHSAVGDGLAFEEPVRALAAPTIARDKRQPMGQEDVVALGVQVDLRETGRGADSAISFKPAPTRVDTILQMWRDAATAQRMPPHVAATLRGKLIFLLEAVPGRIGRAASLVLVQREHSDTDFSWTPQLAHAHEFYEALLPRLTPRRVAIQPPPLRPLLVYTDAMFTPRKRLLRGQCSDEFERRFVSRLGVVIYDPHCDRSSSHYDPSAVVGQCARGHLLYGSVVPPASITATFRRTDDGEPLKTYIAQLEVLGGVAPYYTFPDMVRGRQVNHFIDNTVALSGLVHGYARKLDLAHMVNAFHLQVAGLETDVWLEFVPSLANIADLPSRNEFELLERLGGKRVDIALPPAADWMAPLRTWLSRHAVPPA